MRAQFDAWLRTGLAAGLSPAQVWDSTLADLRALAPAPATLDRSALDALCKLFPDGDR